MISFMDALCGPPIGTTLSNDSSNAVEADASIVSLQEPEARQRQSLIGSHSLDTTENGDGNDDGASATPDSSVGRSVRVGCDDTNDTRKDESNRRSAQSDRPLVSATATATMTTVATASTAEEGVVGAAAEDPSAQAEENGAAAVPSSDGSNDGTVQPSATDSCPAAGAGESLAVGAAARTDNDNARAPGRSTPRGPPVEVADTLASDAEAARYTTGSNEQVPTSAAQTASSDAIVDAAEDVSQDPSAAAAAADKSGGTPVQSAAVGAQSDGKQQEQLAEEGNGERSDVDATTAQSSKPTTVPAAVPLADVPQTTDAEVDNGDDCNELPRVNLFGSVFQSPPKMVHHVDARTKAQGRRAELEALRKRSQVKPKAAKLHNAEAPKEMADFFNKQRELSQEQRQNQRAAQALLHSFRANEITIARTRRHRLSQSSMYNRQSSNGSSPAGSQRSSLPAYATMTEIDLFFRQQRSMEKTLRKERRKTMESLHQYRSTSDQSVSPRHKTARRNAHSPAPSHASDDPVDPASNSTVEQPVFGDLQSDLQTRASEHGYSGIQQPVGSPSTKRSPLSLNHTPPSPARSVAESITSLPDISALYTALELRLREAVQVPLPESPVPEQKQLAPVATEASTTTVIIEMGTSDDQDNNETIETLQIAETQSEEAAPAIDIVHVSSSNSGKNSDETKQEGSEAAEDIEASEATEAIEVVNAADESTETPYVLSKPADEIENQRVDEMSPMLSSPESKADSTSTVVQQSSGVSPTSMASTTSVKGRAACESSPKSTRTPHPSQWTPSSSSTRPARPTPSSSAQKERVRSTPPSRLTSSSKSTSTNSSTARRLQYDLARRKGARKTSYVTPTKNKPRRSISSPPSTNSSSYLFGSIRRTAQADKNRRQTSGARIQTSTPSSVKSAVSSASSLQSIRYVNGRSVNGSLTPDEKALQRRKAAEERMARRKRRVTAPVVKPKPKPPPLKIVPLYERRPSMTKTKKEKGAFCRHKFDPNLHGTRGACERCWYWASQDEKDRFVAQGHHLRIMKVRGGCCRGCAVFPRKEDEFPVRLCRRCFHDTHKSEPPLDEWDRIEVSPKGVVIRKI